MISEAQSKADIHVHSKYSDRPSEWFLRRIGAPECYVEPLDIYRRAHERGMDFVTISDHNRIDGALEIAHLPGVFVSDEVTTYFPEDGCKIHCLVAGITPKQFQAIEELRANIYDFQRYLVAENIVYSVAHPLFRVNNRLSIDHLERLLVLFNRFERINGSRDARSHALFHTICSHLTPAMIADMADRHGLEPLGPEPWKKCFTAGSDDHSGLHTASAYTVTPLAATVEGFLEHLRHGDHEAGGTSGGTLRLGHSLYQIAYSYYKDKFLSDSNRSSIIGELFSRLLGTSSENEGGGLSGLSRLIPSFAVDFVWSRKLKKLSDAERSIVEEFARLFQNGRPHDPDPQAERRTFNTACHIAQTLSHSLLARFVRDIGQGQVLEGLQTLGSFGAVAMGFGPYLAAFSTQHKDDPFLDAVAGHFPAARDHVAGQQRKAWITDTFTDVNGVCRTVQTLARLAKESGKQLQVITCLQEPPVSNIDLKNFKPVGTFPLPEYKLQELSFPPFLEIVEYLERHAFRELVISTPGPLGLVALLAAKLLRLPTIGIYHTDFPLLIRHLTHDHDLEKLTWKHMLWFYSQMDSILVPSEYYRKHLIANGFPADKLGLMPHGVDRRQFNPAHRDENFWTDRGLPPGFTFVYVGRISPDKNVKLLLESFQRLQERLPEVNLAVVGDGPLLEELRGRFVHPRILFTGFLRGDDLTRSYASSDALVFPSTTDTFGNVVLEAHASGLPAIVSDRGGPPDIVRRCDSGIVVDLRKPGGLADAMHLLATDPDLCRQLARRALHNAEQSRWEQVLEDFWNHRHHTSAADSDPGYHHAEPETDDGLIALDVA